MKLLNIQSVTCEYKINPLGFDVRKPRFSWVIQSDRRNVIQKAYQIKVIAVNSEKVIWDSGLVESDDSIHVEFNGAELESRTRYEYQVKVWDQNGCESEWSKSGWFETALFSPEEWIAQWITPDEDIDPQGEEIFYLRKAFLVAGKIKQARIYATAAGLYELYVNGRRVGDKLLSPGWTSYHKRMQYQTYDVTEQLGDGLNGIGAMLGDGWYKGDLTWEEKRHFYGKQRALLLQLHIEYEDGSNEVVMSEDSWKASTGPILYSELYHGEVYDARREQTGWSNGDFEDAHWNGTVVCSLPTAHLVAQENDPVRVTEELNPISAFITPAGDTVLDMGQNMVGRIRFKVQAPRGTMIVLKHAEVLDREGNIYFGNLRKARQTVTYIAKGGGLEEYAPTFTFQGFRFVQVEGYPCREKGLPVENFIGEVIHTDMQPAGQFETSSPLVNQLQSNIVWGQRGNFVDVPTDCPQRDERLGWTGDAQVFIRTALFNYQGGPFFIKWLRDLKADQFEDGGVPFVIPDVLPDGESSSTAWGDAAVICPWTVYLVNGDKRLLAEQYGSMRKWVEFIRAQGDNPYLWNTGFQLGDWLGLDATENSYIGATSRDLIATAFYAYSTRIVRDAAVVLGEAEDVRYYSELLSGIIQHFKLEFISPNGRLTSQTQTAYVLALMFGLVEGETRERAAFELNELVLDNDYHLTTGFVGTPYLCSALSENGYHETAVRLLLQDTYPSWLYSIGKGATTIWEHWDSIKPDGSFWSDDMNSFNHYAYGAIGDWMYRTLAGLDMDEKVPAYKRIRIQPRFAGVNLTHVKAAFQSMYGKVVSSWRLTEGEVAIEAEIPANTSAVIILPDAKLEVVRESGRLLTLSEGILSQIDTKEGVRLKVGSGRYRFVYPNVRGLRKIYSHQTRLVELLGDEEAVRVLERHVPGITKPNPTSNLKMYTLAELAKPEKGKIPAAKLDELLQELNHVASFRF
ncbi:MAG: family 78 glycoside hydrolase catalytic domain [Bacillota bacterium]